MGSLAKNHLKKQEKSLLCLERLIELDERNAIKNETKLSVERYNRDDCLSTWRLREWLESLRQIHPLKASLTRPPIVPGDASDNTQNESAETKVRFDQLTADIDRTPATAEQRARWLLAHQLDYFRREAKCSWWDYFRLRDLPPEELVFEKTALSGLEFIEEVPPTGRSRLPVHRYRFPVQECIVAEGDSLWHDEENVGTCVEFDLDKRVIGIRRTAATVHRHPPTAYAFDLVRPGSMPEALRSLADNIIEAKQANTVPKSARYELLASNPPRLKSLCLPCDGDVVEVASKIALDLDHSYLAIQGPPGAGKTYLGGRMIYNLVRAGERIGVTALSHRVILNLLEEVIEAAGTDTAISLAHQGNVDGYNYTQQLRSSKDKNQSLTLLNQGCVVGGTAWLWSDPLIDQQLDYLFIDEAGQMALALALAASRAARNVILLGDPQQLEQPQLGDHPEGAGVAALAHALSGRDTIEPTKGIFLGSTWRLSPDITKFTSEQYYEGRLTSEPGLENQKIVGPGRLSGSGLRFVEVVHEGRENYSPEEVEAVNTLVDELTSGAYEWTNKSKVAAPLSLDDILIVAPFNVQVQALTDRLPTGARVGTVDKFQGQEAPIVIYSMTSSSIDVAPRGSKFLFSRHRMNVATSRAKCLAIVVASPTLLAPPCKSLESMRLANGLCRFSELGIKKRESP
ncbi:MAG: AAA domain-containing protein [Pirellulales bacterium]